MDEMKVKLSTKFMRGLVAKLIARTVRKKYGYKIDIQLNELNVEVINGKTHLHTSVDVELDNGDLMDILKTVGMD